MSERHTFSGLVFLDERPDAPVRRTVEVLRDAGFATSTEGDDLVDAYGVGSGDGGRRPDPQSPEVPLEDVVAEIDAADGGSIRTWADGIHVDVRFDLDVDDELSPRITLWGPGEAAFDRNEVDRETAVARADRLVDAAVGLAETFDPWVLIGYMHHTLREEWPLPRSRPPDAGVDHLPWVAVFGREWFDGFGGRDRLLETPVYEVRELDSDAVLVRTSDVPLRPDADEGSPLSADEYLLEGRSLEALRAEHEREQRTYVDPFRGLEPGALASDVVVCPDHAPFEVSEIDYAELPTDLGFAEHCHVVPVRRTADDELRDADRDRFVRRLVDEDGRPIGERPPDVPPDREFVSLTVASEAEEPTTIDLLALEDPEDTNVVVTMYGLDRVPPDGGLWRDGDDGCSSDDGST